MNQFNPLCDKECSKTFTFEVVGNAFKNGIHEVSNKIVACFYNCFRVVFLKWALVTYKSYPAETIGFIAENSFTDSVLKFQTATEAKGLYDGKATIKTILFSYFRNTMLDNLQKERRLLDKNDKLRLQAEEAINTETERASDDIKEMLLLKLEQALAKMEAADRQIVIWRHLEQKRNEEIAALLNITVPSATNRIYRCMERLKQLIN